MRSTRAFTLIELLVVVGIIAVLIAILLPTLNAAREHSKTIACLSNLRQLAVAAHSYVALSKGSYPIAKDGSAEWDFRVLPGGEVIPGILWSGQGTVKVQQCPSTEIKSPTATDPFTGYNYNTSYIGHGTGEFRVAPSKASQVRRPYEVALFGDGQYFGGTNKYMRAPLTDSPIVEGDAVTALTRAAGTQGYRHHGRVTNVVFCDGHGESLKERFNSIIPSPLHGFLSIDNRRYNLD